MGARSGATPQAGGVVALPAPRADPAGPGRHAATVGERERETERGREGRRGGEGGGGGGGGRGASAQEGLEVGVGREDERREAVSFF